MLHVASVRTPCYKLLRVALAVLRKVWHRSNLWANKSQHFFCSVMAEAMLIIYSLLPNLSATMLHLFAQLFLQCWCHACAHYKCSLKSSGLYPSHDALQVLALLGVVVSVSTPLQQGRNNSQHCGSNTDVGRCCVRLHEALPFLQDHAKFFPHCLSLDCFTRALFHCWC